MSIQPRSLLGALLTAASLSLVAEPLPAPLGGPAFTEPSRELVLPEEWRRRPIRRHGWAEGAEVAVTLDQHFYPALLPLIQEYARARGVDVAVQEGTCGISAGKLADREADIGGFCCPAGESDRLPGLRFHTIGIASLALLVHPDNPIAGLSLDQARAAFSGQTAYWREMPGGSERQGLVRTVARLHCKTRPGHWRLLLDNEDQFSPRLHEVSTIPDMVSAVGRARGAIGYEVLWMVASHAGQGRVKTLELDGVSPADREALIAGRYPLYRTLQVTTWGDGVARSAEADALVAFLAANADRIDPRYAIVPVAALREAGWRFRGDELVGEPTR